MRDSDGQPIVRSKASWDNCVSKAFDQLRGLCEGILADGEVNRAEANVFRNWVSRYREVEGIWPFSEISDRVGKVFEDEVVTDEEFKELQAILEMIIGGEVEQTFSPQAKSPSTRLPLCAPQPPALSFNSEFCTTGRFALGTRAKVVEAIVARGGKHSSTPRHATRYLVIGHFVSRDWKYSNYGTKIERGIELRNAGSELSIISEETFTRFLR